MTPEEKRLLIELARIVWTEGSPDAQRRVTKLLEEMEDAERERGNPHAGDNP